MSIRELLYNININGISPATEQFAGSQGDIKATRLKFILSDELWNSLPELSVLRFRFDGYDGEGNVLRGNAFSLEEKGELSYILPEAITRHGGRICVYLIVSEITKGKAEMELYSFPALMRLNSLPSGGETSGERESFTGLAESAKQSKEDAINAADRAEAAAERLDGDNIYYFDGGDASGETAELFEETTEEAIEGSPLPITSGGVYEIEKRLNDGKLSIQDISKKIFDVIYPIGSVVTFHDSADHSAHLGFVWERFAVGKTLIGIDGSDTDFDTIGKSGGEKKHTLTVNEMPTHKHYIHTARATGSSLTDTTTKNPLEYLPGGTAVANESYNGLSTEANGNGQPHNNMPPYIVTAFWIRRG